MVNFLCAGDTLLVCANGHLTDNKLAVGLLFPCLLTSDIFALPIENVLLVPDYTMEVGGCYHGDWMLNLHHDVSGNWAGV